MRSCKESPECGYIATCPDCDGCDDCCDCQASYEHGEDWRDCGICRDADEEEDA